MLRIILSSLIITFAFQLNAQTYFYISDIDVQPNDPTTADNVSIELTGGLSSTGAYVSAASATITNNVVNIYITAMDDGGATVIVPHTETITLGMLDAGQYTIVINGTQVDDLAAVGQHFFEVTTGGAACDSLDVISIQWHPFTDTSIVIHVSNMNLNTLFDYPNFILFDANGDTLAMEITNFFGIGIDNWHVLPLVQGAVVPESPFFGTLELWTGFTTELACSWTPLFDLCPADPCVAVYPTIQNFGGGLAIGEFDWTISDTNANIMGSGTWTMTDTIQYVQDTICLPPGSYTMDCFPQDPPSGGQSTFGIQAAGWLNGPNTPVVWSLPTPLEFDLFEACIDGTNGLPNVALANEPSIQIIGTTAYISNSGSEPLGSIILYDAQGKSVVTKVVNKNSASLDLQGLAVGMHILRVGSYSQRLIIGAH